VEANTVTKPNQYLTSTTDLTVQLGGVPITLVRTYDSLSRDEVETFGYGWRLANRDSDIQTSVLPTGHEATGSFNVSKLTQLVPWLTPPSKYFQTVLLAMTVVVTSSRVTFTVTGDESRSCAVWPRSRRTLTDKRWNYAARLTPKIGRRSCLKGWRRWFPPEARPRIFCTNWWAGYARV
jgi:hypothetical protein